MYTFTEENYLKCIFKLSQKQKEGISTNSIADKMHTKASSVTDMIKKMADKKLVNYKKYQGVSLTVKGKKEALKIIRKHRLWEVFLLEHLKFHWDEIHDIAEELEHINSDRLIEKLDQFLNYPKTDPHGDPIPDKSGQLPAEHSDLLCNLKLMNKALVVGVNDKSPSFLKYLDQMNIQLHTNLEVMAFYEFDQSMDIRINDLKVVHLSYKVTQNILITETC
jgi:DtxR family transcriptional regulator, Mn-dependent transcriptional regulator